ncbi:MULTISPECIES: DUF4041 domain-containing protein [unclassified Microcoleus]|uniref:DUF4041 domain-containing protein n=1 Tax=unclassified Microcoleus TaxID=2642155 RepID=UPI002FD1D21C
MSLTLIGLIILILVLFVALVQAKLEQSRLRQRLRRYEALNDKERYQRQLESNIQLLENQQESLNTQIINRQQELRELAAKAYLQSLDYYEPKYSFTSYETYMLLWESTQLEQEEMQKNKQAFICHKQFYLNNNEREGENVTRGILDLIEFLFEMQFKDIMKNEVKYNNFPSLKKKLEKTFKKINGLSKKTQCEISQQYFNLKIRELNIKSDLENKEQKDREMEQEIKKENKQREAIEKARQKAKDAEQRERLHQQELEEVRKEIEQAEGERRNELELKIRQLEEQLAEDRREKENANGVKWGYIYIISNIGSFGKDIYRICMTNRQREDEYIKKMNPAAPFRFDIHFKIFSEDALDTLERLHQRFDDKRVNLENSRREFFQVSIDEIEQAVQEINKKTGFLRIDVVQIRPEAYEYHQTLAARKKHQQLTSNDSYLEENGIASS